MVRTIFEFRDGSSIAVILPLHTPIRDPGSSGWARAGSTVLPAITTRPARRHRRRSKNLPVRPLGSPQRGTTHTELWGGILWNRGHRGLGYWGTYEPPPGLPSAFAPFYVRSQLEYCIYNLETSSQSSVFTAGGTTDRLDSHYNACAQMVALPQSTILATVWRRDNGEIWVTMRVKNSTSVIC